MLRVNSPPLGAPTCDATGLMNGLAVSRGKGREVRERTRSRWPLGNRDVTDRVLEEGDKRADLCTIEDRTDRPRCTGRDLNKCARRVLRKDEQDDFFSPCLLMFLFHLSLSDNVFHDRIKYIYK